MARRPTTRTQRARPAGGQSLEQMAEEIYDLRRLSHAQEMSRQREGPDLTDSEFFTLDLLHRHEVLSVGQLQRRIGVLPAQMSRVIRSLERGGAQPLIRCAINPQDRRKVNVTLTDAGRKTYLTFKQAKLANTISVLEQLPREKLETFFAILREIKTMLLASAASRRGGSKRARQPDGGAG